MDKNYILMNTDKEVLRFNLLDQYLEVLNNDFLPYALKNYVKTTDISSIETYKKNSIYMDCFKDYLCKRTLNLNRENAKSILHTMAFPQSLATKDKLRIVLSCQGLNITDNIWIKEEKSTQTFDEVNLRNHHLKDAAYEISILGKDISVCKDIIAPDIGTNGMFAKTWVRLPDRIVLWKTDKTVNNINSQAEIKASNFLDNTNVSHVKYRSFIKNNLLITECKCLANDEYSLIDGYELRDYCYHNNIDFLSYVFKNFTEDFSKMCVVDYLMANTDRHLGNIQFLVDNSNNTIISMAPLFDHNQAFIADYMHNNIDDLLYEATNETMLNTAVKYYEYSNIEILSAPEECQSRLTRIQEISQDYDNIER